MQFATLENVCIAAQPGNMRDIVTFVESHFDYGDCVDYGNLLFHCHSLEWEGKPSDPDHIPQVAAAVSIVPDTLKSRADDTVETSQRPTQHSRYRLRSKTPRRPPPTGQWRRCTGAGRPAGQTSPDAFARLF